MGLPGARKRFWETHANKLDKDNKLAVAKTEANRLAAAKAGDEFKKASQEFAEWLFLKDLNYVKAVVIGLGAVSYTHLDVYKRQYLPSRTWGIGSEQRLRRCALTQLDGTRHLWASSSAVTTSKKRLSVGVCSRSLPLQAVCRSR